MLHAILAASVLLAVGLALRMRVAPIRALYLPASVVAGIIGFALVQGYLQRPATADAVKAVVAEWASWPGPLVSVVFAALLLEGQGGGGFSAAIRRGARSGILAWIIILGQLAIGAAVYVMVRGPFPNVPGTFTQLLEVSWAGGHGTSAGMGQLFIAQDWPEGQHLAFFLATVGLIYGVLSGLVLVNLAIRRGWTAKHTTPAAGAPTAIDAAANAKTNGFSAAIGSLTLQVVILAMAYAIGIAMKSGLLVAAARVLGPDKPAVRGETMDALDNLPLFLFTLLGGGVVRIALRWLRISHLIDVNLLRGIVGVAMDFLIVAAIASMRVDALSTFFIPIAMLIVLAAAWSAFCLLFLSPRLLPRAYWFELGLLNYGFSTANTPQGFMLLRIVDPDLRTGAAEDYAVAAPLSAPFVGGGVLTFVAFPLLIAKLGAGMLGLMCAAAAVVLYILGRRIARTA